MAVVVSGKNYTLINDCESLTGWSGLVDALVTDFFKEGSNCIGMELWQSGNNDHTLTGSWDLSGTKHLRLWWMTTVLNELNTDANGGFQIGVSDGTNTGFYLVSGSTTYPGGWYNPVIDLSRAVDSGIKPTMTAITSIILRWNLTANAKKVQSCWIDHLYIGDGLIAYGTLTSSFDFDDILAKDEAVANGWGIIRKVGGVYYLVGSLEFGDSAGTGELDFKDISQVVVFEDRKVNASLYNFTVVANATGATQKFQLGDVSGGRGISGCVIRSEGTPKYDIVCTDTDVDDFKLYGCTFYDADDTQLPANSASREVIDCTFEKCGQVVPDTCKVQYCNFISSDATVDAAILINDDPHYVTDCSFINCPDGVEMDTLGDGNYDFDDLVFTGCTYDVNNTCGSPLTVTKVGTSNPSTYTGSTVTFAGSVTLTVTVVDKDNNPIENVQTAIYKSSDDSQLMNEDTNASGVATESYTGSTPADVYVRVRKSSVGATKYIPASTTGTIVAQTGYSVKITLQEDPNA